MEPWFLVKAYLCQRCADFMITGKYLAQIPYAAASRCISAPATFIPAPVGLN